MTIKASIKIEVDGKHKTYLLNCTAEAVKSEKTGKTTLAHFQPADGNTVVKDFSKLYIDTVSLEKALKVEKGS